jgi:hypothetical protein
MATSVEDAVARLTDFSQPMDVAVFEQLVAVAYAPGNPQQQASGHALVHLQEHPGVSPLPLSRPLSLSLEPPRAALAEEAHPSSAVDGDNALSWLFFFSSQSFRRNRR